MKKADVKIVFIAIFLIVLLANCPTGTTASLPPNTILISGFAFSPSSLTVSVGTTVHWINQDPSSHTVTSDPAGPLASAVLGTGQAFDFLFTADGAYSYICTIHTGMNGSITVTP